MTMKYIAVKNALQQLLIDNANGQFQVVGAQKQEKSAEEFKGTSRMVEVYFKRGNFPKIKGRYLGPVTNEAEFAIEFTVSAPSRGDLSVLDDPEASVASKQAALAGVKEASFEADNEIDELISIVWDILMGAENEDLGLTGIVSSRWVDEAVKNDPNPRGSLVVLNGAMPYSCNVLETPPGETPLDSEGISLENDINEDDNQKAGISVT